MSLSAVDGRRQTREAASLGANAMFTGAHDLQIVDANFNVVDGGIHNHNSVHYHYERKRDIWAILQSVPNFRDIYHDMLEKATPGTGMWLIKSDKFRIWLEPNGDIKIFWGSGIPCAGKTVLASIVIEHLEALRTESGGAICVCYVYFRYSQRIEVTVRNILETIVKQILERHPECQALIESAYTQHLREGSEPTTTQLLGLLRELASRMACTFYVLDALDEAPTKIQLKVLKVLTSLDVKLFITSRPLEAVETNFPEAHTLTIIAQDSDIDLHIAKGLCESAHLMNLIRRAGPSLREEIVSTIKHKCGGMFLHASLQLEALCRCINAREVLQTLSTFPFKIEDVYLRTWDRILKQERDHVLLAKAVFVWVLTAPRPMTMQELECAVATSPYTHRFEPDRVTPGNTLMSLCCGLAIVEEESQLVRLVHYTVKETLERLLRESFPHPHSLLAAVCMNHLATCGFQNTTISSEEEFRTALNEDPLLAYASEAWAFHAHAGLDVQETKRQTAQFITRSHAFPAFTSFDQTEYFDILPPLHILALYNLPMALAEGTTIDSPNLTTKMRRQTPLVVASRSGHQALVAHLLALPETQVNTVDDDGWSVLMRAARGGMEGVVKLLLAHPGIEVNLGDDDGWSALMLAAFLGEEGVVKLLLAHPGIKVNLRDRNGRSALVLAVHAGQEGVVELLLANLGIQVNLVDGGGYSALMQAARGGMEGMVKLLLAHPGIEVNLGDDDGWSALMLATFSGEEGIVKLFLAHPKIKVNLGDKDGCSALMQAADEGQEGIVNLLLQHPKIQVNLVNKEMSSAFMLAASAGHESVVKLLLAHLGIDVNMGGDNGLPALMLAVCKGWEGVVELLLAHPEVQVNLVDKKGWSALTAAARWGQEGVVKLLLANPKIQVNNVDNQGCSPLLLAARWGQEGIVKLLLTNPKIRVNLVDNEGCSPLMLAARWGQEGNVKLLLAYPGIKVNLVNRYGCSALMRVARVGQEGGVRLLLASPNIEVNLVDKKGWSALMLAARWGKEGAAKLLLAAPNIQVDLVDDKGRSALLLATFYGHEGVVKLLLATGAFDVNALQKNGDTAIKMAAKAGHKAIVRLFLDIPNVQTSIRSTKDGHTAMSAAQAKGHNAIVKLLRDFETRGTVNVSSREIGRLFLHETSDEDGSDSSSEEAYHDAEEGAEEDTSWGYYPIPD